MFTGISPISVRGNIVFRSSEVVVDRSGTNETNEIYESGPASFVAHSWPVMFAG